MVKIKSRPQTSTDGHENGRWYEDLVPQGVGVRLPPWAPFTMVKALILLGFFKIGRPIYQTIQNSPPNTMIRPSLTHGHMCPYIPLGSYLKFYRQQKQAICL